MPTSYSVSLFCCLCHSALGKKWKIVEILNELPDFVYSTSETLDFSKRILFTNGLLYCIVANKLKYRSALVFGYGHNFSYNNYQEWSKPLTIDDVISLAYKFQKYDNCFYYSKNWKKELTLDVSNCEVYDHVFHCNSGAQNAKILYNELPIMYLNVKPGCTINNVLDSAIETLSYFQLYKKEEATNLLTKLRAMKMGRLRFLTQLRLKDKDLTKISDVSFGQIVNFDGEEWVDADIYLHLPSPIREIIWEYTIDLKQHRKFLTRTFDWCGIYLILNIQPQLRLINFDDCFTMNRIYDFSDKSIKCDAFTTFDPTKPTDKCQTIENNFQYQWNNLPRIIEFKHPIDIIPISYHRPDLKFPDIYLYNALIVMIKDFRNWKNNRFNSFKPTELSRIRFGRKLMWTFPYCEDVIRGFEKLHGEIKGIGKPIELMNYFISVSTFNDELQCIRNLRYLQKNIPPCPCCQFNNFKINYVHGLVDFQKYESPFL